MWKAVALIVLSLTLGAYLLSTPPLGQVKEKSIKELVKDKSAKERANIKGDEIVKKAKTQSYVSGDFTIEIQSIEKIEDGVQVFARAWKNGQPVGFGSDGSVEIERFRIINPPVLVPDGTCTPITEQLGSKTVETCQPNFREDAEQALKDAIAHTIQVSHQETTPIAGKRGNTTSTFYPDANVESTSVDGYVGHEIGGGAGTWATVRGGAGNIVADSSTLGIAGTQDSSGNMGTIYRFVMLFDTSSIPDTDAISSATLSLYGRTGADQSCTDHTEARLNYTSSNPASNTALATTDYPTANFGSTTFTTEFTYASFSTSAYNDGTLNASGIANISVSSVSKFAARNTGDITDVEPTCSGTQATEFRFESADQTGTTNDPKLVVVHAAAAAPSVGTFFWGEE